MSVNANKPGKASEAPEGDEGFLGRWSRRKNESQHLPQADVPAEISQAKPEAELCDADMPALDSLNEDSDYSGFLSPGVSEALRKLALRKLFQSPAFNVCDGLDDYDEDYTSFTKLGDIITVDMKYELEREAKLLQQLVEKEPAEQAGAKQANETQTSSSELQHETQALAGVSGPENKDDDEEAEQS